MACAKSMVSVAQTETDVFLLFLNMPHRCPFNAGVASFRYEIDISSNWWGCSNRRTIRSVSSQNTTVTLALCLGDLNGCHDKQHVRIVRCLIELFHSQRHAMCESTRLRICSILTQTGISPEGSMPRATRPLLLRVCVTSCVEGPVPKPSNTAVALH